jgi:acetolactate synthase-1/2/3 large subunit
MGFGFPAIGAKLGRPDKDVFVIMATAASNVHARARDDRDVPDTGQDSALHNGFLGMVRQWQELFYENRFAVSRNYNPDFVKICSGDIPARHDKQAELLRGSIF